MSAELEKSAEEEDSFVHCVYTQKSNPTKLNDNVIFFHIMKNLDSCVTQRHWDSVQVTMRFRACGVVLITTVPFFFFLRVLIKQITHNFAALHGEIDALIARYRGGCDCDVEQVSLFESYVTLPGVAWSITLKQSLHGEWLGCRTVRNLTAASFGGEETNFLRSKFAIDSSIALSRCLLLLYFTCKNMPEASFQHCWHCQ